LEQDGPREKVVVKRLTSVEDLFLSAEPAKAPFFRRFEA
jgi:hypothetical protein